MARTSNIFARVEPEVKEQAEFVLEQLGIPMSNAIGLFLRQVVLQRGIPFEVRLPQSRPLSLGTLTEEQFNAEIEKGLADLKLGRVVSAEKVADRMRQDYKI
ncbi:MAG: type II toxin-antitoxin system RelB/DinJ family antitoxin [Desulfotomaculaceae bacterium]|nr:type II toxin-antitoxin system RelB/DinJ family antitoxin [Desulfotomaculaceae bacterium]